MDTIQNIRQMARAKPKKIVLPEYEEPRVQQAARIIEKEKIADVLLLTPDKIDPGQKDGYIREFYEIHKAKIELDAVKKLFDDPLYYAAMMTRAGLADGFVAGAVHTTADMARAALRCLELDKRTTIACSCFIMVVPNCPYGEDGTFIFADCGIIPEPNARQLACIAIVSAELAVKVLGITPRVALLSYSTKGSASGRAIGKITEAMGLIKSMKPDLLAEGELQVDAAIVPEVAKIKYPGSLLAGRANVLIFPNLEAGNIGYKIVERLSRARALGPLILGFDKPCSDLSRGCSVDDIVDCAAVTAIRAQ